MATESSVYVVMCASCTVNTSTGEKLGPGEVAVLDPDVFRSEEEAQYKVRKLAEMGMPAWYCKSSIGVFSKIQMKEGKMFSDTDVTPEETRERMLAIREYVQENIDALEEDL